MKRTIAVLAVLAGTTLQAASAATADIVPPCIGEGQTPQGYQYGTCATDAVRQGTERFSVDGLTAFFRVPGHSAEAAAFWNENGLLPARTTGVTVRFTVTGSSVKAIEVIATPTGQMNYEARVGPGVHTMFAPAAAGSEWQFEIDTGRNAKVRLIGVLISYS